MTDQVLVECRQKIDAIDKQLVVLLTERFRVTQRVGEYKRDHNLPPVDTAREAAQEVRITALATEAGLDPAFARKMLRLIIDEVVKNHKALRV